MGEKRGRNKGRRSGRRNRRKRGRRKRKIRRRIKRRKRRWGRGRERRRGWRRGRSAFHFSALEVIILISQNLKQINVNFHGQKHGKQIKIPITVLNNIYNIGTNITRIINNIFFRC